MENPSFESEIKSENGSTCAGCPVDIDNEITACGGTTSCPHDNEHVITSINTGLDNHGVDVDLHDNIHEMENLGHATSITGVDQVPNGITGILAASLTSQQELSARHDLKQGAGLTPQSQGHQNEAFATSADDPVKVAEKKVMKDEDVETRFLTSAPGQKELSTSCPNDLEKENEGHEADLQPGTCGLKGCHPIALQKCRNMACFTAAYSINGMMTSALAVFITSQITALERHFNFNSSVSGLLMSCNDLGYLLTTLVFSYYTRKIHIPRALALSSLMYGISGLLCTIAFFGTRDQLPSPPKAQDQLQVSLKLPSQMCGAEEPAWNASGPNGVACGDQKAVVEGVSESWRSAAICIIGLGMVLQGIAKSPRHPFIGTYVDDNVPKTRTTMYLGIISSMAIFGPAVAFMCGAVFSQTYVTLEETSMSRRDPRWIGAWWLGFLVFGAISLVAGIPILFFPRYMYRKSAVTAAIRNKAKDVENTAKLIREVKGILKALLRLITNPVYVMLNLGVGVNLMSISGMIAFLPKYFEVHYNIPAWKANMFIGSVSVISACLGTVLGGFVTSRFKLGPIRCLRLCLCALFVAMGINFTSFLLKCDQPDIIGGNGKDVVSHPDACSCHCNQNDYFPTCGADGRNYFSPCHAGCHNYTGVEGFVDCLCLSNNATTATAGLCEGDCGNTLVFYIIVSFLLGMTTSFTIMPIFTINVRSIGDTDKPFALGISAFCATLLGWFPGPVLFGVVVDKTCLIWKDNSCSSKGRCLLYDVESLRNYFHGLMLGLRAFFFIMLVLIYLYVTCTKRFTFQPHSDTGEINIDPPNNNVEKGVEDSKGFHLTLDYKKKEEKL